MGIERTRILKKYAILCEGRDAELFLIEYLNSDALAYDKRFRNDIQVFDFGGINDLQAYLSNLMRMEGFEEIDRLLIIRDAERDPDAAVSSIKRALESNELLVPERCGQWYHDGNISVSYALLPSCSNEPVQGTLEDMCWELLSNEKTVALRDDVETFVKQIEENYNTIGSHEHKSRLHTYFSVNEKYVSLKLGQAAKAGAFDWSSDVLKPLKNLIAQGFDSNNSAAE